MAKNLVAGETTKITESGSNISVELTDTMKNKINSIPNITIGTTTTGDVGTEASVSNSGTATNMILNFTIPKGANGQDGQDGADGTNGADGEDGITPHIGENGNWYLGDEDTGKPSRGIQGETGEQGQPGQPGSDGEDGQDGVGFTTASAGTPTQSDGYTVTPITFNKTDGSNVVVNVSAKNGLDGSGGTGGTTDYSELENKPKINNVELTGNRTLAELGIQPEGNYLESESDPTVPNHVKNITQQNINDWNNNGVHYLSEQADRMHTGRIYTKSMDIIRVYGYTSDIELELSNEFSTKNRPIVWERKSDFDLQNIPTVDLLLELKSRGFKNINKVFMNEIKSNKETNITDI